MSSRVPRYVDVAEVLESEIRQLTPNFLLPTEQQLSRRFNVSRMTIRAALDLLENSGLVSRLRGRGTVVSPSKVTRHFAPISSFERDLTRQGISFETRVLSYEKSTVPPAPVREQLGLSSKSKVGCLSLVRLVDDRIVCHDLRYYPPNVAKRIDPRRAEREDCSKILEDVVGAPIKSVDWESEIVPASAVVAEALGIVSRTLIFASRYTWFVEDNRAVEAGLISYRVDRCKFRFQEKFRH